MSDPTFTTHYLNADFDLGLRPRPRQAARPALARQVAELSLQALLGANRGDAVMVRVSAGEEYLEYLAHLGIEPRVLEHPRIDRATRLRPFGWSAEAIELNRETRHPARHPPLESVRHVNSRSFGHGLELETELAPAMPWGGVIESVADLERALCRAPRERGWILKAEFGNAGLANRRLPGPALSPRDLRFLDEQLSANGRLVLEPWLERERDWSVVFEVPFAASTLRIHEVLCTRDGALVGAWYQPAATEVAPWRDELSRAAEIVAARLAAEGYFGPVCMDAFTFRDPRERARILLRPLVELNCRQAMSDPAYRCWRRLAPERHLYYRFFNRRKLELPAGLGELCGALGQDRFDPARRRGVVLASPPTVGKLAVLLVGRDREDVQTLEHRFRQRFEA